MKLNCFKPGEKPVPSATEVNPVFHPKVEASHYEELFLYIKIGAEYNLYRYIQPLTKKIIIKVYIPQELLLLKCLKKQQFFLLLRLLSRDLTGLSPLF